MKRKVAAGILTILGAATISSQAAGAAPKPDPNVTLTIDCPGTALDGPLTSAAGFWAPGFVNGTVGVPVAFGEFSGTFTPPGGDPEPFTEPPVVHNTGNKGGSNPRIECTYTVSGSEDGATFTGSGSVIVALVGQQ